MRMLEQPKWFEINISTIRQTCERFIPRTVTSFTFWIFLGGLETPQMALGAQKTILCFSMIYDDLIILRYSILVVGTWIYDDLVTFIDDL